MNNTVKPFAVISGNGSIIAMLQTNEKGFKKSIENNQIWAVNPDTRRLLPAEGLGSSVSFREKDGWYEVVVSGTGEVSSNTEANPAENEQIPGSNVSGKSEIIEKLFGVIEQRKKDMPEGSYTTHLFSSGMSKIRKKTGEEAVELLLAEGRDEIVYESADLIYHMLVLLAAAEIRPEEIFSELESRE